MISASIVLYNTEYELLAKVIKSYNPGVDRELFIVDNSKEKCVYLEKIENRYVHYIFVGKNVGYGSAHNIGIKKAIEIDSEYHIVLNPDLYFEPEVIDELAAYANNHQDVVYMMPKVVYPNGEIQYLCKLLPTPMDLIIRRFLPDTKLKSKLDDRYVLKYTGYDKIMNPPCLSGCFMFMRTKTLREHNLFFDERFFMYCEDFDLMRRLHRVGKTIYYPSVQIVHDHKRDSYKNMKMLLVHIQSAAKYFCKYGWFIDKERKETNQKVLNDTSFYIK